MIIAHLINDLFFYQLNFQQFQAILRIGDVKDGKFHRLLPEKENNALYR